MRCALAGRHHPSSLLPLPVGLHGILPLQAGLHGILTVQAGLHSILPLQAGLHGILPLHTSLHGILTLQAGLHGTLPLQAGLHTLPLHAGLQSVLYTSEYKSYIRWCREHCHLCMSPHPLGALPSLYESSSSGSTAISA